MQTHEKPEATWSEANQHCLIAALALVKAKLAAHFHISSISVADAQTGLAAARAAMPSPPALEILAREFRLTPFEQDMVLLCAGVELAGSFSEFLAQLPGSNGAARITFSLALAALPSAHWTALSPDSPLRYWRLLELTRSDRLVHSPLKLDERILHFLTGVRGFDERLEQSLSPVERARELPASHQALADRVVKAWSVAGPQWPIIQLCGPDPADHRAIASVACKQLGMALHVLSPGELPTAPGERHQLLRLWQREAVLSDSALLVDFSEDKMNFDGLRFAELAGGAALISARQPMAIVRRPALRFDVSRPTAPEQRTAWTHALGSVAAGLNGELDEILAQFRLSAGSIDTVAGQIRARAAANPGSLKALLWEGCRQQVSSNVGDLAQQVALPTAWNDPAYDPWADLILPEAQKQVLRTLVTHVRRRSRVYERWGFAARGARGLGISALFVGPSGTGKTLAAEVIAHKLALDLYRIDLSAVVSKYIGETEKNLCRIFDAAESGGTVLVFDEADALFGRRSEVKDSHDRYANIEVSYLLQRMEAYRGLAILTTNMKQALDAAFARRLRFTVEFPFPDLAQRRDIWRRVFPAETPTQGLSFEKLARLNVTGGHIRNIALGAAFMAADEDGPVQMRHLLEAARAETTKLERPLIQGEVAGWI